MARKQKDKTTTKTVSGESQMPVEKIKKRLLWSLGLSLVLLAVPVVLWQIGW